MREIAADVTNEMRNRCNCVEKADWGTNQIIKTQRNNKINYKKKKNILTLQFSPKDLFIPWMTPEQPPPLPSILWSTSAIKLDLTPAWASLLGHRTILLSTCLLFISANITLFLISKCSLIVSSDVFLLSPVGLKHVFFWTNTLSVPVATHTPAGSTASPVLCSLVCALMHQQPAAQCGHEVRQPGQSPW